MPGPTTRHSQFVPTLSNANGRAADLICLSHLRWNFVFQRPQHLMTRFAAERRVFFFEEPLFDAETSRIDVQVSHGVHVVVPHLRAGTAPGAAELALQHLMRTLCTGWHITKPVVWVYTPMALPLVDDIDTSAIVYDCMDELTGFSGASPELCERERELFSRADVVFTGGHSLYEAKRRSHRNVHPFPSSVDVAHFAQARRIAAEPADQQSIPRPRLGFAGVIDERMNLQLVGEVASLRPDWQIVMIGPIVKIDPATLPQASNIHYLGMRKYEELPAYLAGWDVAMLPFAHNAATRYISPTKTPEYLAAGCPVVSTSVSDVVRPYGEQQLVQIADTPADFVRAAELAMGEAGRQSVRKAGTLPGTMSWDRTWAAMKALIDDAQSRRYAARPVRAHIAFEFGHTRPATSAS
ncbi:MAG: glycosyltransferase family 1 protein [Vicinamibacterales bacterium]